MTFAEPHLDHVYCGSGIPLSRPFPFDVLTAPREQIAGAFHVKREVADNRGTFAVILDNGEGKDWLVFDLGAVRAA